MWSTCASHHPHPEIVLTICVVTLMMLSFWGTSTHSAKKEVMYSPTTSSFLRCKIDYRNQRSLLVVHIYGSQNYRIILWSTRSIQHNLCVWVRVWNLSPCQFAKPTERERKSSTDMSDDHRRTYTDLNNHRISEFTPHVASGFSVTTNGQSVGDNERYGASQIFHLIDRSDVRILCSNTCLCHRSRSRLGPRTSIQPFTRWNGTMSYQPKGIWDLSWDDVHWVEWMSSGPICGQGSEETGNERRWDDETVLMSVSNFSERFVS